MIIHSLNIFEYNSYRDFLKDIYIHKKSESKGFSHRVFVRMLGFSSPNFLKLVFEGKRNLGKTAQTKIFNSLKLNQSEKKYLDALIQFEHAKSLDDKTAWLTSIARMRHRAKVKTLEVKQYDFLSNWYCVALRELVQLSDFSESPKWINKKLHMRFTAGSIRKMINNLIELGLLIRTKKGKLIQSDADIVCPANIYSLAVSNYHKEMLGKAIEAIDKVKSVSRDISGLTISVGRDDFENIKKTIEQCRQQIHQIASFSNDKKIVCQVNFQIFPLSEAIWS